MKKYLLLSLLLLIILIGCTQTNGNNEQNFIHSSSADFLSVIQQSTDKERIQINDSFAIDFPGKIYRHLQRNDGSYILTNYDSNKIANEADDFAIHIFAPSPNTHCEKLGVSKPITYQNKYQNTIIQTGEMDFYNLITLENSYQEIEENKPLCQNFFSGPGRNYSHAFCAKRNDQTVLLCLYHKKDDLKVVNQIFDSFRWVE